MRLQYRVMYRFCTYSFVAESLWYVVLYFGRPSIAHWNVQVAKAFSCWRRSLYSIYGIDRWNCDIVGFHSAGGRLEFWSRYLFILTWVFFIASSVLPGIFQENIPISSRPFPHILLNNIPATRCCSLTRRQLYSINRKPNPKSGKVIKMQFIRQLMAINCQRRTRAGRYSDGIS